jgi:hypothetical protein
MDDRASKERQAEGLRLVRAFLRIKEASRRAVLVETAERLIYEAPHPIESRFLQQKDDSAEVPGDNLD